MAFRVPVPECENGIVLTCVPGHDWTRVVRKKCIYTNEFQWARTTFFRTIRDQQRANGALPMTIILDGYKPYHVKDWCLQHSVELGTLRNLNIHLFFTGNYAPETNLLLHLEQTGRKLFVGHATRRSARQQHQREARDATCRTGTKKGAAR